mgnify:CR=1 FL=1
MAGTVDDLPISGNPLDDRRVKALEDQARAMERSAAAVEQFMALPAQPSPPSLPELPGADAARAARFERMLHACLYARTSTTVEGFLSFARELCDGMDREFPQG